MRLFTDSYLSDIDNIVPFENTTPINQNKRTKQKNAEQVDQINRSGIFELCSVVSVKISMIR